MPCGHVQARNRLWDPKCLFLGACFVKSVLPTEKHGDPKLSLSDTRVLEFLVLDHIGSLLIVLCAAAMYWQEHIMRINAVVFQLPQVIVLDYFLTFLSHKSVECSEVLWIGDLVPWVRFQRQGVTHQDLLVCAV